MITQEKEQVLAYKEKFKKKLIEQLTHFDKSKPLHISQTGSDGPMLSISNEENLPIFFEVYQGTVRDYRPYFAGVAEETLSQAGFSINN